MDFVNVNDTLMESCDVNYNKLFGKEAAQRFYSARAHIERHMKKNRVERRLGDLMEALGLDDVRVTLEFRDRP